MKEEATRVHQKCHDDPSLAVAHKCFWELRLQDEIRLDFTVDEPNANAARAKFLSAHEREDAEIRAKEQNRRANKAAKADDKSENGPIFDDAEATEAEEACDD